MKYCSTYRPLTEAERRQLEAQHCTATDWADLRVADTFTADDIADVHFDGRCYLGRHVTLRRIATLSGHGPTTFANGIEVAPLKEDGGLEVVIHDHLTSMEATMQVMYAADARIVEALRRPARERADEVRCDGSVIDDGVSVSDCRLLANVHLASGTTVSGARRLTEVSTVATTALPVVIGDGVILDHCIVGSESHVTDGAQLDYCYVGQACHIGRMYSATQSLFFANCHMENGEACALLAGPYSVSHHKATLLIASRISFFNAGSGSNQSNHSYKLGPNKWGQLCRGTKLGSSSYLYWPMQTGVFTSVIGHHTLHADLRDLPFSLMTAEGGRTVILPGQNLTSVGTYRDATKWPARDHRSEQADAGLSPRLDVIDFELFSPYTLGQVSSGLFLLEALADGPAPQPVSGLRPTETYYNVNGAYIPASAIGRGIERYRQAIAIYVGRQLAAHPDPASHYEGSGEWEDYGGMVAPEVETLHLVLDGRPVTDAVAHLAEWQWNWTARLCAHHYGRTPAEMTAAEREALVAEGRRQSQAFYATLLADAERDLAVASPSADPADDKTCRALRQLAQPV